MAVPAITTLIVTDADGSVTTYPLGPTPLTIGRHPSNAVVLANGTVSTYHAKVVTSGGGAAIADLGSLNGTYVNGRQLGLQRPWSLQPSDVGQIGPYTLRVATGPVLTTFGGHRGTPPPSTTSIVIPADLGGRSSLSIGRDDTCDQWLNHPLVSRLHAVVQRDARGALSIADHGSMNGLFVNGARVTQAPLTPGDMIQIGECTLIVEDARAPVPQVGGIQVDAVDVYQLAGAPSVWDRASGLFRGLGAVSGPKTILSDVSVSIRPGEFVAVVGGSGTGKTTLMRALCGFRMPAKGHVLYNGQDLASCFGAYRGITGYVPQDDILHRDLTLHRALTYAAMLRLPADTTPRERRRRVDEVLAELDLTPHRDTFIEDLSGGQRKRASIGVELLTRPRLFFLDEPTSGLDPVAETLIMKLLREMANQGRTLILITHATQNIMMCHKVAFMSRGGTLAFYGSPQDALNFFNVQEFVDAYRRLEQEPSIGHYASEFRRSPYRAQSMPAPPGMPPNGLAYAQAPGHPAMPQAAARPSTSSLRQFSILTRRSLDILLAARRSARQSLAVLLLQAPLIAIFLGLIFHGIIFDERPIVVPKEKLDAAGIQLPPGLVQKSCGLSQDDIDALPPSIRTPTMTEQCGDARKAMLLLFLLSVVTIWLGASNAAKEIVKELAIYRRERMAVLGVIPYVASKLTLLSVISLVQAALLLMVVFWSVELPSDQKGLFWQIAGILLVTFGVATLLGLLISAVASSPDFSTMALPIILLPQIFFAGAMLAIGEMAGAARYVSALTLSRWSWEALGTVVDIPRYATAQGGPMLSLLEEQKWRHTFEIEPWRHVEILGLFGLVFLVTTLVVLKRRDEI